MQPLVQGSIFSSLANHRCCQTLYGQTITAQSYTANKGTIKHSNYKHRVTIIVTYCSVPQIRARNSAITLSLPGMKSLSVGAGDQARGVAERETERCSRR